MTMVKPGLGLNLRRWKRSCTKTNSEPMWLFSFPSSIPIVVFGRSYITQYWASRKMSCHECTTTNSPYVLLMPLTSRIYCVLFSHKLKYSAVDKPGSRLLYPRLLYVGSLINTGNAVICCIIYGSTYHFGILKIDVYRWKIDV